MTVNKKSAVEWAMRFVLAVAPVWLVVAHPVAAVWILAVITIAWISFPRLERMGVWVPGPRSVSHGVLYIVYTGYVYLLYRYISPWVFTSISQMIEAGKDIPEVAKLLPAIWHDFRRTLEGFISPESIDKGVKLAQETLQKHGLTASMTALAAGRSMAMGIATIFGVLLILPLVVLMLHTAREEEEQGARAYIARVLDGHDGPVTTMVVDMWQEYVRCAAGIFRAILWAMVIYSGVYACVLLLFRLGFGGDIQTAAHLGYSILLGVLGGIPLFGGMINWGTISYVGYTTYGFTIPFVCLFIAQMVVHKSETGLVTPKLMGSIMHIPLLGLMALYALALALFGVTVTGFVASFLLPPLALAFFEGYDKWLRGYYAVSD